MLDGSMKSSWWCRLIWVGLAWVGLAWAGLAWAGLAWAGLAWAGPACACICTRISQTAEFITSIHQ